MSTSSRMGGGNSLDLPHWIFDIEEIDDIDYHIDLLTELDVDVCHTRDALVLTMTRPLLSLVNSLSYSSSSEAHFSRRGASVDYTNDFFGPCLVISSYCLTLWILHVKVSKE